MRSTLPSESMSFNTAFTAGKLACRSEIRAITATSDGREGLTRRRVIYHKTSTPTTTRRRGHRHGTQWRVERSLRFHPRLGDAPVNGAALGLGGGGARIGHHPAVQLLGGL